MLINEYFQEIRHLIEACPIVQSYNLITDSRSLYVGFIRGDLNLVDGTLLHIREFVNVKTGIERGKYTYQYMSASNDLVFRYDNAPHHQELNLPNYPHHKHIGSEENIISSNAPSLADVLKEIEENR
ncbi:MAG: DUF6516 family protein [Microcystis sp.]